jgi:hypothetical protein
VIVRATILLATVLWAAAESLQLVRPRRWRLARTLWTAGVLLAAVHAAAAMHLVHGWDHDAALEATARQTAAVVGLDWGGGLYVNYAFVVLWLWDAASWWMAPAARAARPRWHSAALSSVFLFMFVNGAIVFAAGIGRAVGTAAVLTVAAAWYLRSRERTRFSAASHPAA